MATIQDIIGYGMSGRKKTALRPAPRPELITKTEREPVPVLESQSMYADKTQNGILHKVPPGMKKEDYDYLSPYYEPDQIDALMSPYKPDQTRDNYLERIYSASRRKPELDEKQMKRRMTAASIADSFALLAQMFAASKGAPISNARRSATQEALSENKRLQAEYEAKSAGYDDGLMGVRMREAERARQEHEQGRKTIQALLLSRKKEEAALAAAQQKRADAQNDKMFDRWFKMQGLEAKEKDRAYRIWKGAQDVYLKKEATDVKAKKDGFDLVIDVAEGEKGSTKDNFGKSTATINITKGEADKLVSDALKDPGFQEAYPELFEKEMVFDSSSGKSFEKPKIESQTKQYVARAYYQYLYNKQRGLTKPEEWPTGFTHVESEIPPDENPGESFNPPVRATTHEILPEAITPMLDFTRYNKYKGVL